MSNLTLEHVAQLAGVSRSTVSRVVNNQSGVREDVRRRVWEVIDETGYRPNLAARALASNRTGIINLIVPHAFNTLLTDPYFLPLTQGITRACSEHDLSLTLFLFHNDDEEIRLARRIENSTLFDGVIIAASQYDDPLIPYLLQNEVPLVLVGRQDQYPQISFVDADNLSGAYIATTHLLRLGYTRIAHITGPLRMAAGEERLGGYRKALSDRGLDYDPELVAEGDFTEIGGYIAMKRLLACRPHAVFAASDRMAMEAWKAIEEAGLRVPQDIALIGFDDLQPAGAGRSQLTTIRQPVGRVGSEAVSVLLDVIEHGPEPQRRVIFDTELVIRDSCGAKLGAR